MATPDDSGTHDLSKTVDGLSPSSTLPDQPGQVVMLTRANAENLVGGIHKLAKANLRLYKENKWIKRLLGLGVATGVVITLALGFGLWTQVDQLEATRELTAAQAITNEELAAITLALGKVEGAVDEVPRLELKPAPAGDPSAAPVVVLKGKTKPSATKPGQPPPAAKSIEVELDVPTRKRRPKKGNP